MRKRVFISHPFVGNEEYNRKAVSSICKEIAEQGYLPLSPLNLFDFLDEDGDMRDDIMQVCYDLIDISDEVWIYGCSAGCRLEYAYAKSIGKKVVKKR